MDSGTIRRRAGERTNPPSLLEKLKAYQSAIRSGALTPYEFTLLLHVVDGTVGWGRPHVDFTYDELTARCNMSKSSVERARRGLERQGFIEVSFAGHANRYSLAGENHVPLPLPKRLKNNPRALDITPTGRLTDDAGSSDRRAPIIDIPQDGDEAVLETVSSSIEELPALSGVRSRSRSPSIEEAIAGVDTKVRQRRGRDMHTKKVPALGRTWQSAHEEAGFPAPLAWTSGKLRGQAKTLADTFPGDAGDLHAFLNWTVQQWNGKVKDALSWMTEYPPAPTLGLVLNQIEKLLGRWRESTRDGEDRGTQRQRWGGRRAREQASGR